MSAAARQSLGAAGYAALRDIELRARGPGRPPQPRLLAGCFLFPASAPARTRSRPGSANGTGWGSRWSNVRDPSSYMAQARSRGRSGRGFRRSDPGAGDGRGLLARLAPARGLGVERFRRALREPIESAYPQTGALVEEGLLAWRGDRLTLTPRGLELADSVFAQFF